MIIEMNDKKRARESENDNGETKEGKKRRKRERRKTGRDVKMSSLRSNTFNITLRVVTVPPLPFADTKI